MKIYWHTTGFVPNPHACEPDGWLIQDARHRADAYSTDSLAYPRRTRVVPVEWANDPVDPGPWITPDGEIYE